MVARLDSTSPTIAVRREDVPSERRSPLAPQQIQSLRQQGIEVVFERCERRIFSSRELEQAGARVEDDLTRYPLICGIKEIARHRLEQGKSYLFFSHTMKGQSQNMPLLRRMIELGCTLLDYERVTDDSGRRLLTFGHFAGVAGAVDSLWALGRRLMQQRVETPLATLSAAPHYDHAEAALADVARVGQALRGQRQWPEAIAPLVIGIAGSGNTSGGAQQVLDALGAERVPATDLPRLRKPTSGIYQVVFEVDQLVEAPDGHYERAEYFQYPHRYRSVFRRYLPHLTVLLNCSYWEARYPRLVRIADLRGLFAGREEPPRLHVIGDIACDVRGAIEATVRATWSDDPVYVYDVVKGRTQPSFDGTGPAIMAVYNLPAELPRDASQAFSEALLPFISSCARCSFSEPSEVLELPQALKRATIVYRGALMPDYDYLGQYI
jgi:hypothetical protein